MNVIQLVRFAEEFSRLSQRQRDDLRLAAEAVERGCAAEPNPRLNAPLPVSRGLVIALEEIEGDVDGATVLLEGIAAPEYVR